MSKTQKIIIAVLVLGAFLSFEMITLVLFGDTFTNYRFEYVPFSFSKQSTPSPGITITAYPIGFSVFLAVIFYFAWRIVRYLFEPLSMGGFPIGRAAILLTICAMFIATLDCGYRCINNLYIPLYTDYPYILILELLFLGASIALGYWGYRYYKRKNNRDDDFLNK